jgi:hypothetical protein
MSAFSVPAQVRQWRSWIHGDIYSEVMGMFLRRKMWLDVDQMLGANPSVGLMPSSFWNFYHGNYAAAQSIAIRRQADKRGDTSSLWRLLRDIARKPDLLTREVYVSLLSEEQARDELMVERANRGWEKWADSAGRRFDATIASADARELERVAQSVKVYVDQHLAHDATAPTVALPPTFGELHAAIDSIAETFRKYALLLTGAWWDLDAVMQEGDWRAIFRKAWIEP